MKQSLFQDFDEVSAKQWKQKIQFELQGSDYQNLVTHTLDGIDIRPFYHQDDQIETLQIDSSKDWSICDQIYVVSEEKSNYRALKLVEKGAESIWFIISSEETDLKKLFKNFDFHSTPIYLKFTFFSEEFLKGLRNFFQDKNAKVYLQIDIIGNLAATGNWFANLESDRKILDQILQDSSNFESVISVDTMLYQNAGATIPQQLAYAIAHANEYLNHINEVNFLSSEVKKALKLQFLVAVGPNYFFEIAKIRALRWLFSSIAEAYGFNKEVFILAQPSKRNKTLYDYNVNLLRTTTESMSAILGGADAIFNLPYDAVYHKNNEFGNRIARNQLLIMKHEAHLNKVKNAAEGAYYIENLTEQFAEKALAIFKDIENGGGFLKQLKESIIQKKIRESAEKEQAKFDAGELILIGTNKYQNPADKMQDEIQLYPFLKKNPRKTLIEPILERRLSEKLEEQRLATEKTVNA
ncbi:heterodimeric methylmalonyl-CoA mutase small subunit [Zunongwangia mangrovi]|uniref:Heterodimeric methylmalonyl-CoA mutase small subunit n=1 Tax=Zunongwangia mangrovi TaxID=1334022 RepID=A0A1I1IUK7_9FLAO|nr:methylmalonyl-CoA mutase subunit beta [Zunongwangia mangrovi]SFC39865.1 heterodimeric methylmalonyl-CoA mutase small subunit [Zunongwangia mangrovi]